MGSSSFLKTTSETSSEMDSEAILITGAGGSIGSALAHALLKNSSAHVVLLDVSEQNLHRVDLSAGRVAGRARFTSVLGDISDDRLIASLLERHRVRRIFHTAAFKHANLLESNALAAIKNNAVGTWKIAVRARNYGVSTFVMLSTDKAVDPIGIMGATKRAAEMALLALEDSRTRMLAIRLGNVWGTQGSVVPLFLDQIEHGGPVTVTDPAASRYFFSLDDAVDLILSAAELGLSGVVIPRAGSPRNILALAEELIANSENPKAKDVQIVLTGLKSGEKLTEAFVSADEKTERTCDPRLFAVTSEVPDRDTLSGYCAELSKRVELREMEPALETLKKIVPNYKPSRVKWSDAYQRVDQSLG